MPCGMTLLDSVLTGLGIALLVSGITAATILMVQKFFPLKEKIRYNSKPNDPLNDGLK